MALDGAHIPEQVYDELIEAVHEGLPLMYRYMQIRKQVMAVDELHMYDVYVPLTKSFEKKYTFEEAKALVKDALSVMGEEYVSLCRKALTMDGSMSAKMKENEAVPIPGAAMTVIRMCC